MTERAEIENVTWSLPLLAALLKGHKFDRRDSMQFYLTSFVVLLLQALGAPAMAYELAEQSVASQPEAPAQQNSDVLVGPLASTAEFTAAARQWSQRVMRRAQQLYSDPVRGLLNAGYQGSVKVRFQTGDADRAQSCSLAVSSGAEGLDAIACQAVLETPGPPIIRDIAGGVLEQTLILPLVFIDGDRLELEEGAP